jgi:hypothetical protein
VHHDFLEWYDNENDLKISTMTEEDRLRDDETRARQEAEKLAEQGRSLAGAAKPKQ